MTTAESIPSQSSTVARCIAVDELVSRKALRLNRDPSRVLVSLFVPGSLPLAMQSRAAGVVTRVLAMRDEEVEAAYTRTMEGFGSRHRDLERTFAENFRVVEHRVDDTEISELRKLLVGAHFTHEYAIEGAALTNPSMVEHPDQSGLEPGELRFLMSARAIGEGHLSCVEFRTGVAGPDGELRVDEPSRYADVGRLRASTYERSLLAAALTDPSEDDEVLAFLLRQLPARFSGGQLESALGELPPQLLVLDKTQQTVSRIHWFLACQYRLEFDGATDTSERVLWPVSPTERHGIEDARFVRCADADGTPVYRATYTAFDGLESMCQLIETADFRTFQMSQMFGQAVGSKGLALFPRLVGGRHLAMSRWDRENNAVAFSDDGRIWSEAQTLQVPPQDWNRMKVGNCGSPIETEAGWLVITHGVGPMRVYGIGAILLDLQDPTRVLGTLNEPLLIATPDERDGYVPNVVYSCGALKHDDTLVIPYGFGDMGIEFATLPVSGLVDRILG